MANPEHLEILKQGVKKWNQWKNSHRKPSLFLEATPALYADLTNADLSGMDLCDVDFSRIDMRCANLKDAKLIEAKLMDSHIEGADLSFADLTGAELSYVYCESHDFSVRGMAEDENLFHVGAPSFEGANLLQARFFSSSLADVNFKKADLSWATFRSVEMHNADLSEAILNHTTFANTDLNPVKGLHTIKHTGPSYIDAGTIYKFQGHTPDVFLRGCGVPETFITFHKSLVNTPIEFYSCFISYSSRNQDFAERLHADLQIKGVRCWYAPEDLKIGDKFRVRIDESIRTHEKLLLILSKDSVESQWVEKEVETAMERERQQGRESVVLFPIKLDDAILDEQSGWAADIRRTRHVGDFRGWKNHDEYRKAFDRLLRDLRAESKSQ